MKKLLILLFLLTACQFIGTSTKAGDITGNEGLKLTILPLPPKTIYEGQGFSIPVTIENVGASRAEDGILLLTGYDPNLVYLSTQSVYENINLNGKTTLIPAGERTSKIFTIASINLFEEKEIQQTFKVVACYKYKTEASPIVCVNPKQAIGEAALGSCDYSKVELASSQGAPIAVTKVEVAPNVQESSVTFLIYLSEVSQLKGTVLTEGSYSKPCRGTEQVNIRDINSIGIEAFLSGSQLRCFSGREEVGLANTFKIKGTKEPSVICAATNIDIEEPAYTTPLTIRLSYGHVIGEALNINLKRALISG